MSIWDNIISRITQRIVREFASSFDVTPIVQARAYREGYYRQQLSVRAGQFNDNIGLNLTGLLVNRIVSQMFGKGIILDFEGDTISEPEEYINRVLDVNKQEVLFHRCGVAAAEAGTGYLMIIPDGLREGEAAYPRIQLVDPMLVEMDTLPEDYEVVIRYTIQYKYTGEDGKEKARKRVIEHSAPEVGEDGTATGGNTWAIRDYVSDTLTGGKWIPAGDTLWPYPFAPIIHWQNLPAIAGAYGEPDITDNLLQMQDRINFVSSNVSKIIRYYAHPMRIAKNIGSMERVDVGSDQMMKIAGDGADVVQLDPLGDLASSMAFLEKLVKSMYATARVVDLHSYEDKLGALTNFGLRVLYQDNLSLIDTKREIFGDMLAELIRRLLILSGRDPIPCAVVWPDFLPLNSMEEMTSLKMKLEMGLTSHESAAKELGIDWDAEKERIEGERAEGDNIGAALLRAFNQGGGGNNF
jgi:hypothetical protein